MGNIGIHNAFMNKKKSLYIYLKSQGYYLGSGFLSILLVVREWIREIAIGDNLLIYPG